MSAKWSFVLERAIREDGSLLFPERLTQEFLLDVKKTMGSYLFSNQYMNEIIPAGESPFKREWLRYYQSIPDTHYTFAFIDPAISTMETADYTALVIIDVDPNRQRYLRVANRYRITPTQIVELIFRVNEEYHPQVIGLEDVAYQKALLYMLDGEMRRRNCILPVTGVRPPTTKTKEMKILGLVPHFEWGRLLVNQGLHDFETEYAQFPRGSHDDILDALASIEQILYFPTVSGKMDQGPRPNEAGYESWYIKNKLKNSAGETEQGDPEYDVGDY